MVDDILQGDRNNTEQIKFDDSQEKERKSDNKHDHVM